MKDLITYYSKKGQIFTKINEILPKELNSRKKIKIYDATTLDMKFYAIFVIDSKSRFIKKNADDLMNLEEQLAKYLGHNFKIKELLIKSEICSKAKAYLKENSWSVRVDFK